MIHESVLQLQKDVELILCHNRMYFLYELILKPVFAIYYGYRH